MTASSTNVKMQRRVRAFPALSVLIVGITLVSFGTQLNLILKTGENSNPTEATPPKQSIDPPIDYATKVSSAVSASDETNAVFDPTQGKERVNETFLSTADLQKRIHDLETQLQKAKSALTHVHVSSKPEQNPAQHKKYLNYTKTSASISYKLMSAAANEEEGAEKHARINKKAAQLREGNPRGTKQEKKATPKVRTHTTRHQIMSESSDGNPRGARHEKKTTAKVRTHTTRQQMMSESSDGNPRGARQEKEATPKVGKHTTRQQMMSEEHSIQNGRDEILDATVEGYPPLTSLIGDKYLNVTGDPQFLLDFAILGFAKCGTSTMMRWIDRHPMAQVILQEVYDLIQNRPARLVNRLYTKLPPGDFKRGYKSPNDIYQSHVLKFFHQYWPKTQLLVGLRHPVRWFESLYNFKTNNYNKSMLHPNELIGGCFASNKGLCTYKANFHWALAQLGKTNITSSEERATDSKLLRHFKEQPPKTPNKIFLFTMEQLADSNDERAEVFRKDVARFVGLEESLMPPMIHVKPGKTWDNATQAEKDSRKIDICNQEYDEVRTVLVGIAKSASTWIRRFFLESEDVIVSSREYFEENVETWMHDPCDSAAITDK